MSRLVTCVLVSLCTCLRLRFELGAECPSVPCHFALLFDLHDSLSCLALLFKFWGAVQTFATPDHDPVRTLPQVPPHHTCPPTPLRFGDYSGGGARADGVDAWLDKAKLLPGEDWELEIRKVVCERL